MEMLKFGKFAALSLALAVAVGCSSKGGDASGEGAVDPNAGYGANTGAVDGSLRGGPSGLYAAPSRWTNTSL